MDSAYLEVAAGGKSSWTPSLSVWREELMQRAQVKPAPVHSKFEDWLLSIRDLPDQQYSRELTEEEKEYWQEYSHKYHLKHKLVADLLTVWMPTPLHDTIEGALIDSWCYDNSHLPVAYREKFDLIAYEFSNWDEEESSKTADAALRLKGVDNYPCLVFEVGFSQPRKELLGTVAQWFRMTGGVCKIVVIVLLEDGKIEEKAKTRLTGPALDEQSQEEGNTSRNITGEGFGPYYCGNNVLMGKLQGYLEVWRYSTDYEDRLKAAMDGDSGAGCDKFVSLIPSSPDTKIRFLFQDLLEDSDLPDLNVDEQYFDFSLKRCRERLEEGVGLTARYRARKSGKVVVKDPLCDPKEQKGKKRKLK